MALIVARPESNAAPATRPVRWRLRAALIGAVHVAAVVVLLRNEYAPFAVTLSLITLALMYCLAIAVFGRPGIAAALSIILIAALVAVSQFKYDILQVTITFLDFLIVDPDTVSFLSSVFPHLKWQIAAGAAIALPVLWLIWKLDPFRIRRLPALGGAAAALVPIVALSVTVPEQPWEPFQGVNHISNLARSGVASVSNLVANGWLEADPQATGTIRMADSIPCDVKARHPHVILLLDESSFDIRAAPGIKVPDGYADFFKSVDGRERTFIAEAMGGPTWYTEFNVLAGLSARSFGKLRFYVTRIAAGHIQRGLPQALRRCGYRTFSLYPTYGNFLGARHFQQSTGVGHFVDMADMGVAEDMQPDQFYFGQALKLFARERARGAPLFTFVYLTANHFPWNVVYRSDLTPGWRGVGNTAEVDEYIRRQKMTADAYAEFTAELKRQFPGDSFVIVRFGDHQPAISPKLLEPGIAPGVVAERLMKFDPRYFSTYYAIDTINFDTPNLSSALDVLDAAYLPIVVQEAAGLPLDASFAEQKKIMLRCGGLFYACKAGAEARRFNRMLMDAGVIKGL